LLPACVHRIVKPTVAATVTRTTQHALNRCDDRTSLSCIGRRHQLPQQLQRTRDRTGDVTVLLFLQLLLTSPSPRPSCTIPGTQLDGTRLARTLVSYGTGVERMKLTAADRRGTATRPTINFNNKMFEKSK